MNLTAWTGLALMVVSETATLWRIEPFWSWNTPIAWTGFILFADAIVWEARRSSWIRSNAREFALLALASIPLWLVFEGYNRFLRNWYYTGLSENVALRMFGYAWAFATIWPAIFEGAELVAVLRARSAGKTGWAEGERGTPAQTYVVSGFSWTLIGIGALMLALPFLVPSAIAAYMAAPVWLGFIFLLDPLNAWLGAESLAVDLRAGEWDRLINLALGGLLCGVLWEFWNYWAGAKWHYTVPIMERLKLFEMPVPGYLGFPAFACECFTMYVFVRAIFLRLAAVRSGTSRARAHGAYEGSAFSRTRAYGTQLGRTIAL
jgi:hypothetical protein